MYIVIKNVQALIFGNVKEGGKQHFVEARGQLGKDIKHEVSLESTHTKDYDQGLALLTLSETFDQFYPSPHSCGRNEGCDRTLAKIITQLPGQKLACI